MKRSDVLDKCKEAAEAIMHLPPGEWAGWIGWMMEALDDALVAQELPEEADTVLKAIHNDLHCRIYEGRW